MKNIYFIPFFILISFTFCKKNDPTPEPVPANNNTNNPPVNFCPDSAIYHSYCFLEAQRITKVNNNIVTKDSMVSAEFYDLPLNNRINTGTVTLNNMVLNVQSSPITYSLGSPLSYNISSNLSWNASGTSSFTAFSYAYVPEYPIYSGQASLLDTFSISNGININISGITNYTFCTIGPYVEIRHNSPSPGFIIGKRLMGSAGTFSLTNPELASLFSNVTVKIKVSITNYRAILIGSKEHGFLATTVYEKIAYLKP